MGNAPVQSRIPSPFPFRQHATLAKADRREALIRQMESGRRLTPRELGELGGLMVNAHRPVYDKPAIVPGGAA